jgi:hypothetical protein
MKHFHFVLHNTFHGTSYRVRLRERISDHNEMYLTPAQVARAHRALCGIKGCTCGGIAGQRMEHCPTIIVQ